MDAATQSAGARRRAASTGPQVPFRRSGDAALNILIGYNPRAGRFSQGRLARLGGALARAGHRVTMADSRDIAPGADATHVDVTCLFGGDGTARDVLERASQRAPTRTRYIVYPAGTVNLVAREARYPSDPAGFVARLAPDAGPARRHFAGRIGAGLFLCCASVGPDSAAVTRVSPRLKRWIGRLAYVAALAGLLVRWPRYRLTVTVDGAAFAAEAAYVCKSRFYAGPWVLDPAAHAGSDSFRVLILPRAARRDLLRLALSAIVSPRFADPRWVRLPGQRIRIEAEADAPLQADGDPFGLTPATIEIAPNPLPFV